MNSVLQAALQLQTFCLSHEWKFCFIGEIAVQHWAEPRVTRDADITLLTGFGQEESFVDALLAAFPGRREDARDFALARHVLLLETNTRVGLDVVLGALPFEALAVARASHVALVPDCRLRLCSPEDLIVFKVFAGRPLDLHDVEMTLVRQGDANLDWQYIWAQLIPLLELQEQPEKLDDLMRLRTRLAGDS